MRDDDAQRMAQDAMVLWGVVDTPRLIKNRENAVFETITATGERVALRLHRPGYQSDGAIRSELWWAEALVQAGMNVPVPVRTLAGDVIAQVADAQRIASVVTWCEGEPMGEGDVPLPGSAQDQAVLHFRLGAELARLHQCSDVAALPSGFSRPDLDHEALLGPCPAWGKFWENPTLASDERDLLQTARAKLRQLLQDRQDVTQDYGLIHADALRENVLVHANGVTLIDFDDGAFGYRMYELGVAMSQNWDQSNRTDLGVALLKGYRSVRALPEDAEQLLEGFTVMRGLASCGWVIGRYAPDAPQMRTYAARAVEMCRRWL